MLSVIRARTVEYMEAHIRLLKKCSGSGLHIRLDLHGHVLLSFKISLHLARANAPQMPKLDLLYGRRTPLWMAITTGLDIRLNFHVVSSFPFKILLSPGNAQNACETAQLHLTCPRRTSVGRLKPAGHMIAL
jgi:hypothetical protein